MSGEGAYLRYTELFNREKELDVPSFTSAEAMNGHSETLCELDDVLDDEYYLDVEQWISDSCNHSSE